MRHWSKTLSVVLALAIVAVISAIIYMAVNPNIGEGFTEFYILNIEGNAEGYPEELSVGEEGSVLIGIVNREAETTEYRVDITINDELERLIDGITLESEEAWEEIVSFTLDIVGEDEKIEFLLYKGTESEPYIVLRLYVDVI